MNSHDIARRRMYTQHLWGTPLHSFEDVVRRLGALQAQEFPVAKWSVGQRAKGVGNAAIDKAFADGAILRTHVLRPTWHFVLPEDIRWMLALTAPRVNARMAYYDRQLELDGRLYAKTDALIAKGVQGGAHLTRKELGAVLDRGGIAASGQRLGHIVMRAELDAVICSGAPRGKQHTYASLDERAPHAKTLDRDDALAELTRRYFTAHGPATLKDYMWWSSLPAAEGRRGIDAVTSHFEHEFVDGRTYWFTANPARASAKPRRIDLVQGYDECIVSYTESKDVLRGPSAPAAITWDRLFLHAVLLDGRLIGHWRRGPKDDAVVVETSLYRRLDRAEAQALDAAADRYGRFLGVPVTVRRGLRSR